MIELLCTLTGIIAGVAVVASLLHAHGGRRRFEAESEDDSPERMRGIADQLQVISHRVAADVSAHSERVEHFSGRLAAPTEQPEELLSTINEIITANQAMQGQLADAQKRIAQQSRMIEQASHQARTDALTGLANRRALDEFLENCLSSLNEDEAVGLLLMDIDHFKKFNDSFGHTTGDAVLSSFARSISQCCGETCYAARFGGEEFAVILTGPTPDSVARSAAAVRYFISEQVISYEDLELSITSSAGLCMLLPNDNTSAAYERADEGLYQSKNAGRNCGFWLSEDGWLPFPKVSGEPKLLAELKENPMSAPTDPSDMSPTPQLGACAAIPAVAGQEASAALPEITTNASNPESELPGGESDSFEATDILDLKSFLDRLDAYLAQLRKSDLPASAAMVEAAGLSSADRAQAIRSWDELVRLVEKSLRGIDVVCLYRPYTLCIFMPGCSLDAGIDRAARIQTLLREAKEYWKSPLSPDRFLISVGGIDSDENSIAFLNRLESGLDDAIDASPSELVVHTGEGTHFQEV